MSNLCDTMTDAHTHGRHFIISLSGYHLEGVNNLTSLNFDNLKLYTIAYFKINVASFNFVEKNPFPNCVLCTNQIGFNKVLADGLHCEHFCIN